MHLKLLDFVLTVFAVIPSYLTGCCGKKKKKLIPRKYLNDVTKSVIGYHGRSFGTLVISVQ